MIISAARRALISGVKSPVNSTYTNSSLVNFHLMIRSVPGIVISGPSSWKLYANNSCVHLHKGGI